LDLLVLGWADTRDLPDVSRGAHHGVMAITESTHRLADKPTVRFITVE
jgi:hypothetical protein